MAAAYRIATASDTAGAPLSWAWAGGTFVASVVNTTYNGENLSTLFGVGASSKCTFGSAGGIISLGELSTDDISETVIALFGAAGSSQQLAPFGPLYAIIDENDFGLGPANLNAFTSNPNGSAPLAAEQLVAGENVGVGLVVLGGHRSCFPYYGCPYAPSTYDCPP